MSRRFYVVVAATALAAATLAQAAQNDRECTREAEARDLAPRAEIAAAFAHAAQAGDVIETETGRSAPMGPLEVMVVRKGKDGKITYACVDSAAAAERFLTGKTEPAAKAKEQ